MEPTSESPLTIQELTELTALELARRGQTMDDVTRDLRSQLQALRGVPSGTSLEARVTELEAEVRRLRVLIGNGSKNG